MEMSTLFIENKPDYKSRAGGYCMFSHR